MTAEPLVGDRVRFRVSGRAGTGVVTAIVTAGRKAGRGIWALRRRARIRFDADGRSWETYRDVDAVEILACDEQLDLLGEAIA